MNQYIERGGNIKHVRDFENRSVLHYAVEKKYLHIVALFLEHGVDPLVADNHDNMPFHLAIEKGHDDIAALLVQKTNVER